MIPYVIRKTNLARDKYGCHTIVQIRTQIMEMDHKCSSMPVNKVKIFEAHLVVCYGAGGLYCD